MKVTVSIVNAFIENDRGGNPAGVVLKADGLSHQQKLSIAKKVGLSETAFVSNSAIADFKLEFFTPNRQIAHCGHATIATFSFLAQQGMIVNAESSKETIDGVRKVNMKDDMAFMEQLKPKYESVDNFEDSILNALGLFEKELLSRPCLVNTGNSFVILGVKDRQTLEKIKPNQTLIEEISQALDLIGFYIYTPETEEIHRDATTRMFAPRYGIDEEAATGMAAGPLACYLHDYRGIKKTEFLIEQGYSMMPPSPSLITVKLNIENSKIRRLSAGGKGVLSRQLEIEI